MKTLINLMMFGLAGVLLAGCQTPQERAMSQMEHQMRTQMRMMERMQKDMAEMEQKMETMAEPLSEVDK